MNMLKNFIEKLRKYAFRQKNEQKTNSRNNLKIYLKCFSHDNRYDYTFQLIGQLKKNTLIQKKMSDEYITGDNNIGAKAKFRWP